MISKIDCRDKKIRGKAPGLTNCKWYLDSHHMSFYAMLKNLHQDTAMPDKRRLQENVLIRNYEGIRQCFTENFWMYSITLTANRIVSKTIFLTSTLHQAGKVMTWEAQGLLCHYFFLVGNIQFLRKDDKITYMTEVVCLENSALLQRNSCWHYFVTESI